MSATIMSVRTTKRKNLQTLEASREISYLPYRRTDWAP